MNPLLIYLFPALMDAVASGGGFICTVLAAKEHYSASVVANLITVTSLSYMISCLFVGRLITEGNAARLLVGACLGAAAVSVGFATIHGIVAMYGLMVLFAICTAFFFVPFQIFMKRVNSGTRSIGCSVGLYTLSWSTGYAVGPFIAGFLWTRIGWQQCYLLNAAIAALTAVGVLLLKHQADAKPAQAARETEHSGSPDYSRMPDLAWLAWLCGGIGCITFALIRGVLPKTGAEHSLTEASQGMIFFVFCMMQAIVGLLLARGRFWMYRPVPLAIFGLFGVAGLATFAVADTRLVFYLAAACYGVYSGAFFFYLVFHALVHPVKGAQYVSINEAVVGVTGVIGPLFGGLLADHVGLSMPYFACAGLVVAAVAVQAVVHRRPILPAARPQLQKV